MFLTANCELTLEFVASSFLFRPPLPAMLIVEQLFGQNVHHHGGHTSTQKMQRSASQKMASIFFSHGGPHEGHFWF